MELDDLKQRNKKLPKKDPHLHRMSLLKSNKREKSAILKPRISRKLPLKPGRKLFLDYRIVRDNKKYKIK
jgi:hypothetical protein